jgi:hypothetical protein
MLFTDNTPKKISLTNDNYARIYFSGQRWITRRENAPVIGNGEYVRPFIMLSTSPIAVGIIRVIINVLFVCLSDLSFEKYLAP